MNRIRIVFKFVIHFLTAKNSYGFGVHSPFIFHFTKFVIYDKSSYYIFSSIEKIRSTLIKDKKVINFVDFGTGKNRSKSIKEIASKSLKSAKYGQFLYRVSDFCKASNILELGTSFGLTTSYLASSLSTSKIVSLEGSQQIANIAIENFNLLNIKNIKIVVGDINQTLKKVLNEFDQLDLIFIDANHTSVATLSYFEQILNKIHSDSCIVIDDIHWSKDMEKAWKEIKNHTKVTTSIDLFQVGIVFFNSDLNRKHYKMRY